LANDSDRPARVQREAEVLAALNHPSIAQIYRLERASRVTALVMELVDGMALAGRIAEGRIPIDKRFRSRGRSRMRSRRPTSAASFTAT
jgi:serine/threonine protein kinase